MRRMWSRVKLWLNIQFPRSQEQYEHAKTLLEHPQSGVMREVVARPMPPCHGNVHHEGLTELRDDNSTLWLDHLLTEFFEKEYKFHADEGHDEEHGHDDHDDHKHHKKHGGHHDERRKDLIRAVRHIFAVNAKLRSFEHGLISKDGIKDREWFRHLGVAPGKWLGYGATTLPGLTEAIVFDKNKDAAEREAKRLVDLMEKMIDKLKA